MPDAKTPAAAPALNTVLVSPPPGMVKKACPRLRDPISLVFIMATGASSLNLGLTFLTIPEQSGSVVVYLTFWVWCAMQGSNSTAPLIFRKILRKISDLHGTRIFPIDILGKLLKHLHGDHSGCFLGLVDIKTRVAFQ